jgi:hypothetical protein
MNGRAVVGIALDRLPTPAETGIAIPVITLAPAASPVADITVVDIPAADIITGAVERITGAVEAITAGDFMQEVSSPGMRPEFIIPSSTSLNEFPFNVPLLAHAGGAYHRPLGFGVVTEASSGFPGYNNVIGTDNATIGGEDMKVLKLSGS